MEVADWLRRLGLDRYVKAFKEAEIDAEVLPELTDADLRELGIPLGPRKKLLKALKGLPRFGEEGAPDRSAEPGPLAAGLAEGERRQVTVLFIDLTGFTRLSAELDAEEVHLLLGRFFQSVDRVVEDHGGSIDKHIGDCVMAVFGAPIAHGNDPERAAHAALAVQEAMPGLQEAVGRALAVHMGIASGQVVASGTGSASHQEYTVTGDTVNLASRLTDLADAGEILVSDQVQRLLADSFALEAKGTLAIKGIDQPVATWRLLGQLERTDTSLRPFVGRQVELEQFVTALEAARETGSGQTFHLRGEAGIGKTRLVEELRRRARDLGFATHTGLVLDFGMASGQDAIRALVRSLLGLGLSTEMAATAGAAASAEDDGIVSPDNRVHLNDLLDLPQPLALRALYDAMKGARRNEGKRETVAELVESLSRRQPLFLVIEDVHWADRPTLAFLKELVRRVEVSRGVLVTTSRIEGDPLDPAWLQSIDEGALTVIDLTPLRPQEAETLARSYQAAGERASPLPGAGCRQSAVLRAAAEQCRGGCRCDSGLSAEPGAGPPRPFATQRQDGASGSLDLGAAL